MIAIAAGELHGLALKADGAVLAWGYGADGALGDGSGGSSLVPRAVPGLDSGSGVVSIAAGGGDSFAVTGPGVLLAWGNNPYGELGDGTTTDAYSPEGVGTVTRPAAARIAAGYYHTLVAPAGSSAVACPHILFVGARGSGEHGPGTKGWKPTPADPFGLGGPVNSAYQRIAAATAAHSTLQAASVSYGADGVQTIFHDYPKYFRAISVGVSWVLGYLNTLAAACPHQQIVLAGFSEGAMVMHRVLRTLEHATAGQRILERLAGAILIGDGDQVPHDRQTRYGSATLDARGIGLALRTVSHSSTAKFSPAVGSRVLSVCNKHDIVCDWTDKNLVCHDVGDLLPAICARDVAVHLSYANSAPLNAAAKRTILNLLAPRPPDFSQGPTTQH